MVKSETSVLCWLMSNHPLEVGAHVPKSRPCQMPVCDLFAISNWGLALVYPSISSLSTSKLRYMPHVCGARNLTPDGPMYSNAVNLQGKLF